MAGSQPLGSYIKARLFGERAERHPRSSRLTVHDKEALARILAMLGRSRLANNLNQLAKLANTGSLPLTPEVEEELLAALADVREVRRLLVEALGLREGAAP